MQLTHSFWAEIFHLHTFQQLLGNCLKQSTKTELKAWRRRKRRTLFIKHKRAFPYCVIVEVYTTGRYDG